MVHSHFSKKGFHSTYTLRFGGYSNKGALEDIDLLLNLDRFTPRVAAVPNVWPATLFSAMPHKEV